jgi:L-threonylcarbamoyladenylate synthase
LTPRRLRAKGAAVRNLIWNEKNSIEAVVEAVAALRAGKLVALPTETVYGLAADAANGEAVARIFEAKGRPRFNPLICHVTDAAMARRYGRLDLRAEKLTESFWPGPLTLVVPLAEKAPVHPLVTAGLSTVALRVPRGPAHDVIAAFGGALAAPSANPSGRLSATRAEHVVQALGDKVALVLDAGPCAVGLESTIVSLAGDRPLLLRPGGLPAQEIEAALGETLTRAASGDPVTAPGMLSSHYAPRLPLRLDAISVTSDEALLAFGPTKMPGSPKAARNLSPSSDLVEAAANLFAFLADLDASGASQIAVAPIPHEGLGEAINDRLARAAAPRLPLGGEPPYPQGGGRRD